MPYETKARFTMQILMVSSVFIIWFIIVCVFFSDISDSYRINLHIWTRPKSQLSNFQSFILAATSQYPSSSQYGLTVPAVHLLATRGWLQKAVDSVDSNVKIPNSTAKIKCLHPGANNFFGLFMIFKVWLWLVSLNKDFITKSKDC